MRYVSLATAVAFSFLAQSVTFGQGGAPTLSITNYQFVGEQRVSLTKYNVTYRADLVNTGGALDGVTASVSSLVSSVQVVAGQGTLHFAPVPAQSQVTTSDTFTILVDRSVTFDWSQIKWTFQPPVANAGANQTAKVGTTVTLNGSGSTNPIGGTMTYSWAFTSRPSGSTAALVNPASVMPAFVIDAPGTYLIALTVTNSAGSDTASVVVSTVNSAPVANAGPNQTAALGSTVFLNGSGSSDVDGDPLTYHWTLVTLPDGSSATLNNPSSVNPSFVADRRGTYVARLIVNDGTADSNAANITVTTLNTPPVANAGSAQVVTAGALVQLNGSGSTDVDGDSLTYQWSLISLPAGSTATLSNPPGVNPTFTADIAGTYVAQLVVNDGLASSTPATVTITTNALAPPTANAGANQTVVHQTTVTLNGGGTDPQNRPLTFNWALISKPAGSAATLSSASIAGPTFVADLPGTYVAQLVVNNGALNSAPATVTITTTNTAPVANAGTNQNVTTGVNVLLDGSGSSDADHDPLTYAWSFTSRPDGSAAVLFSAATKAPMFVADVAGTYVIQLIVNDGYTNSNPTTVMVTAALPTISLSPNPLNLTNAPGTMTVLLSAPAGVGGQSVSLLSSNPGMASVQQSVIIPEGVTGANVFVTPGNSPGSATISASASGFTSGSTAVAVNTPSITVTTDSDHIGLTKTMNGTLTLSAPAPAGGLTVALAANPNGIIDVQPATVNIDPGASVGAFTVKGLSAGQAAITASGQFYVNGTATVNAVSLGAIGLPAGVTLGPTQSAPFQVTLATVAPTGGATITLTSSDPSKVTIAPATVFIAAGSKTPDVAPQVTGVDFGSANISASAPGFTGDTKAVQVTATLSFALSTLPIGINGTQNATLNLSAPAPSSGVTVNLSSDNTVAATVPATAVIPSGATSVDIPVTAIAQGTAIIHASALPNFADTTMTVTAVFFGPLSLPANATVPLGSSAVFPVTLGASAPAGGVTVTLRSADASKVTVTSSVYTAATTKSPTSPAQVNGLSLGSSMITASAPGYTPASQSVMVTATVTFTPPSLTLTGATTQNLTLTLSASSPSPLTINLSSDNTSVATVPATVTFPANATSISVPVTGVANPNGSTASTVIHASALPNIADTTANVTVTNGIILQPNVKVGPNQSTSFQVTLAEPAPSNVFISLNSADTSKVTISPSSLFFPAGQTVPSNNTTATVTGVNFGSANIVASAPGFTTATQSVLVTATISLLPANLTINGTNVTQSLTVLLSAPAPASGLTLNSSSDNTSVATTASTVTIPGNSSSANVLISSVGAGTTTIHVNGLPTFPDVSSNVTVVVPGNISLPSNTLAPPTFTVPFPISLSRPAPAGGVTVNLIVEPPGDGVTYALVTSSVFVPAGATTPNTQPQVTGVEYGTATITASAPGYNNASATVLISGGSPIIMAPNVSVAPGQTATLSVNLLSPAPQGGVTISLASNNTSKATVTASVFIAAGATTPATQPQVTGVAYGQATITASAPSYISANATANVTATLSFNPTSTTITGTGTQNLTLNLSPAAPAGGVTVNLSSTNTGIATVPATVNFAGGGTSMQVPVTGVAPGTAVIHAIGPNIPDTTATATVVALGGIGLPANVTISLGQSAAFAVTLPTPAPAGGVTVNLTSTDTSKLTVTPSVFIAAGATTPATQPNITGVNLGQATINATATGYSAGSQPVQVIATISLSPNSSTITGTGTTPLTVNLSAPAPTGGLTINLSSSNTTVATVPQTVTIAQGNTSATFNVTGVAAGSAVIHASLLPNIADTTANVSVVVTGGIVLASNVTVGPGQTVNFPVSLASAPAGNVFINLSSSDTSKVTISPSTILIPAGQTTIQSPPQVTGGNLGSANINATAFGYNAVSQAVQVVIGTSFIPSSLTITGTATQNLILVLSTAAPAGGITASLSSDNTAVATVPATVTVQAGNNSATVPVTGVASGTTVIRASGTNLKNGSANVTVSGGPSITAVSGSGQSAAAGSQFTNPLVALVKDASNNPAPGVTVTFTGPGAGASIATTTAVTNAQGVASAMVTANITAGGPYTVNATVPGLPTPATYTLTNTSPGQGTITATSGTGQSAVAGAAFGAPLVVTVKDANNNPAPNVTVTFSGPATGPGIVTTTALTNAQGVATATVTANANIGGPYTVNATAPGAVGPATYSLTNTAGAAATITATSGTPQSATVGAAFANALAATVKDANGNGVSGATVTFTGPASGAGIAIGIAATATTNPQGVASFTPTANTIAGGPYNVTATVSGVATPANFSLTNNPGPAATITATSGTPQSAQIGTNFPAPLVATVKDANSNPVPNAVVTFTGPATGPSIGAKTATTNAQGVASATVTANGTAGGPYNVTATSGAATSATYALTNTTVQAASLQATGGIQQGAQVTKQFATQLQATVRDASNNLLAGATVTFTGPATGAGIASTVTAVSDANGVASAAVFANTIAGGPYTVTASSGPATATYSLTNFAGPAATITANSGSGQSTAINTAFANPLTATVTDANNNPVQGVGVTFTGPGSGAGIVTDTAFTNAQGVASKTVTANGSSGGPYTVTATSGSATPATFSLTNLTAPPASVAFVSGSPQTAAITSQFTNPLVVVVKDAGLNNVQGAVVTFTGPANGASIVTTTATTNASGVASATVSANSNPGGPYTVNATVSGVATPATFSLTNTSPSAASIVMTSGSGQTTSIGTAFANPLVATVKDVNNNPVQGAQVTFTGPANGAGIANQVVATNASGQAIATIMANGTVGGPYSVNATVPGAPNPAVFSLTNGPGAPAKITVVSGSPQSAAINSAFAASLVAVVQDASNNVVPGVSVTFTGPATGPGIAAVGPVTTDATGKATVAVTANGTVGGPYNVTAAFTGVATPAVFALTNLTGAPASITANQGSNQTAQINTAFATQFSATVRDANNNLVSGATVTFTGPATGAGIVTKTATTNPSGVATAAITANGAAGGPYSVTATSGSATPATFTGLTNTTVQAATITVQSGTPQSRQVTQTFNPLVVLVKDASNNPAAGVSVTFAGPATGASIASTVTATTDATGVATATVMANTIAGANYIVSASAGAATPANFTLTNTAGQAANIAVFDGNNQSAAINTPFATALKAKVTDANGNPIQGMNVTFTGPVNGAGINALQQGSLTDSTGVASATVTANGITGPYTVSATTAQLTPASFSLSNTSVPASVTPTAGSGQSTPINSAFAIQLSVKVTDGAAGAGNPVSGVTVTFTGPASGASIVMNPAVTATTNAQGIASVTVTANATAGGPYTVQAKVGALTPATFTLTNSNLPVATLTMNGGNGQSAPINTAFATQLSVIAKDVNGGTVAGALVTFTGPATGAGIATATATTNAQGIASATVTANNSVGGPYTVNATSGNAPALPFSLTSLNAAPASVTITSGAGQSTQVKTAFANPLKATVRDINNNLLSGVTVTFSGPATGASFATVSATTDANGVATTNTPITANNKSGTYQATATAGSVSTSFSMTNTAGAAASIVATSGSPQSKQINLTFALPLVATVMDADSNPVPNVSVTFTGPATGASIAAPVTVTTNSQGQASATVIANSTPGTGYIVNATFTGAPSPAQFTLTNLAPAAASITANNPVSQSTTVNTAFGQQLSVTVLDANSAAVPGATVTFTGPSTGATIVPISPVTTDATGTAKATALANGTAGGPYQVTAAVSGTALTATLNLTNTAGPPANITITGGDQQSATVNAPFANNLTAKVTDAAGNAVTGTAVTFTGPTVGAGIVAVSPTPFTNSAGIVTASVTANTVTGTYPVTAKSAAVTKDFTLTNTAGAPASIAVSSGNNQSTPVNSVFPQHLRALVRDQFGNAVPSKGVTFTGPATGPGIVSGAQNNTDSSGIADSPVTANGTVGSNYTVTAAVSGFPGAGTAPFTLTNTAVPPCSVTVSGQAAFTPTVNGTLGPLKAIVKDCGGNPLGNITVTFTGPTTGAGVTVATQNATSDPVTGIAQSTFTANTVAGAYNINATVSGVANPATFNITNQAGAAATVTATSGTPQSAQVATAFGSALSATVKDASLNPVPGVTVTFTAPATGASGTFAGSNTTTAQTNSSGVAMTTTTFMANNKSGSYVVTPSVSGAATNSTFALTNTAGTAATINANSGAGQSTQFSTQFTNPLVATVQDQFGNPVPNITVTYAGPATGPSIVTTTATTGANGQASAMVTANNTVGTYTVNATVPNVGSSASFTQMTNTAGQPASIAVVSGSGQMAVVNNAFALPLVAIVKDGGQNPVSGATVTFTAPAGGGVLSGTFAGTGTNVATATTGADGKATSPVYTANTKASVNSYFVNATVSPVATPAQFAMTNQAGAPASVTVVSGTPQSVPAFTDFASLSALVKDSFNNSVPNTTVTFTPGTSAGGATAIFPGGIDTGITNNSGVATAPTLQANGIVGSYSVVASAGAPSAVFSLSNTANGNSFGQITINPTIVGSLGAVVGKNLESAFSLSLPQAPASSLAVTITSSDPTKLLVAGSTIEIGAVSVVVGVDAGQSTQGGLYIQGLTDTGTVTLTASANGYISGTTTITLTKSAYLLQGPGGASTIAPFQGQNTSLTLYTAPLDPSTSQPVYVNNILQKQAVRGGVDKNTSQETLTFPVTVNSDTPAVGTVTPTTTVVFHGGEMSNTNSPNADNPALFFHAIAVGTATITAAVPSGFSAPAGAANIVQATVVPANMAAGNVTVGKGLQTTTNVTINGAAAPGGGYSLTITSNDPSKFLLSKTSTTAGSASINVVVPSGFSISPDFYVQGMDNTGSALYTVTSPSFASTTGTVNLAPAGFVVAGQGGLGQPISGSIAGGPNSTLTVSTALLDSGLNYVSSQQLAGGTSAVISVTSSDTSVGIITTSPVTISSGSTSTSGTQFHPVNPGDAVISAGVPSGFSLPAQFSSVNVHVGQPGMFVTTGESIGQNLQIQGTLIMGRVAPSGGATVRLTSADSNKLLLSTSQTGAGQPFVDVFVPTGTTNGTFYIQALQASGSVTYTAQSSGFTDQTATVTMSPSAIVITGPFGFDTAFGGIPPTVHPGDAPSTVIVDTARIDAATNKFATFQQLRGGLSPLSVSLTNNAPGLGTVTTPLTIQPGDSQASGTFTAGPGSGGIATISVVTPGTTVTGPSPEHTSISFNVQP